METFKKIVKYLVGLPARLAVLFINLYQFTLSPDHSWLKAKYPYGYCRHYPSCSEYTKQAISSKGLIQGSLQGVIRVARCNPFSKPRVDLLSH
jgi:putative component of membrane protein insertase Oxa1/YidC/SpoIIIJ protein YidD